jgi:hypothetical protein
MSHNIASKLAAVAIAVVMNGVILGGVCYLFVAHAASTSARNDPARASMTLILAEAIATGSLL